MWGDRYSIASSNRWACYTFVNSALVQLEGDHVSPVLEMAFSLCA